MYTMHVNEEIFNHKKTSDANVDALQLFCEVNIPRLWNLLFSSVKIDSFNEPSSIYLLSNCNEHYISTCQMLIITHLTTSYK